MFSKSLDLEFVCPGLVLALFIDRFLYFFYFVMLSLCRLFLYAWT